MTTSARPGSRPGIPRWTASSGCRSGFATRCSATSTWPRAPAAGSRGEDEQLIRSLAATAAVAVENSRLYETARTRGEWLQASAAITRHVLEVGAEASAAAVGPLELIADRTREIARADLVSVLLPAVEGTRRQDEAGELEVVVAVGAGAQAVLGLRVPRDGSVSGQVFTAGEPRRVAAADELGLVVAASGALDVGPVLAVPLAGPARLHGVLSVARLRGRPAFTAEDTEMTAGFANHAAIAIELAQARAEQQRAAVLDDRERIAADLHDHVIQRLFATGLTLQSLAVGVGPGASRDRLLSSVAELDATISQIRSSIFRLQQPPQTAPQGLRARLLQVATDEAEALGFEPAVQFSGLLDTLPDDVAEDLLAVLREALSNIARHARGRTAEVLLSADRQQVTLQVCDDGVGLSPTTRRSGLANLRRRAERRGGTLTLGPRDPCGTCLTWTIPDP